MFSDGIRRNQKMKANARTPERNELGLLREALDSAMEAYEGAVRPAKEALDSGASTRKTYREAVDSARKTFEEATYPAWKAYEEAIEGGKARSRCPGSERMLHHYMHVAICPECKQRFLETAQLPIHNIERAQ